MDEYALLQMIRNEQLAQARKLEAILTRLGALAEQQTLEGQLERERMLRARSEQKGLEVLQSRFTSNHESRS